METTGKQVLSATQPCSSHVRKKLSVELLLLLLLVIEIKMPLWNCTGLGSRELQEMEHHTGLGLGGCTFKFSLRATCSSDNFCPALLSFRFF